MLAASGKPAALGDHTWKRLQAAESIRPGDGEDVAARDAKVWLRDPPLFQVLAICRQGPNTHKERAHVFRDTTRLLKVSKIKAQGKLMREEAKN